MASPYMKIINIAVSIEFLKRLDKAALAEYMSRSAYIRRAVTDKLNAPRPAANHWVIVESLPDDISDDQLLKIVKMVKNRDKD